MHRPIYNRAADIFCSSCVFGVLEAKPSFVAVQMEHQQLRSI